MSSRPPALTHRRRLRGSAAPPFVTAQPAAMDRGGLRFTATGALLGLALLAGSLLLPGGIARAADNGFYLGAGFTQSKIDDIGPSIDFEDDSFKLIAGFRPLDAFGVEFNYIDLGKDGTSLGPVGVEVDGKAYAAYAVGFLPLPFVDLYAKAGVARWEADARTTGISLDDLDDSGTEFAYGAGIQARLGSLAARLEYERFDIADTDGAELISLGVTWTFL
ncbi:MAG: porin family protein [Gammaproteobacteria bacterium]|nr:porin family protein [Gammaproteobacteria bacterium]